MVISIARPILTVRSFSEPISSKSRRRSRDCSLAFRDRGRGTMFGCSAQRVPPSHPTARCRHRAARRRGHHRADRSPSRSPTRPVIETAHRRPRPRASCREHVMANRSDREQGQPNGRSRHYSLLNEMGPSSRTPSGPAVLQRLHQQAEQRAAPDPTSERRITLATREPSTESVRFREAARTL